MGCFCPNEDDAQFALDTSDGVVAKHRNTRCMWEVMTSDLIRSELNFG